MTISCARAVPEAAPGIGSQHPRQAPDSDTSSPKPGGTCSPKPYGCHACTLPSSQSTRKCRNPTPPKGVGFPDPLSGTLKIQSASPIDPAPDRPDGTNHGE